MPRRIRGQLVIAGILRRGDRDSDPQETQGLPRSVYRGNSARKMPTHPSTFTRAKTKAPAPRIRRAGVVVICLPAESATWRRQLTRVADQHGGVRPGRPRDGHAVRRNRSGRRDIVRAGSDVRRGVHAGISIRTAGRGYVYGSGAARRARRAASAATATAAVAITTTVAVSAAAATAAITTSTPTAAATPASFGVRRRAVQHECQSRQKESREHECFAQHDARPPLKKKPADLVTERRTARFPQQGHIVAKPCPDPQVVSKRLSDFSASACCCSSRFRASSTSRCSTGWHSRSKRRSRLRRSISRTPRLVPGRSWRQAD